MRTALLALAALALAGCGPAPPPPGAEAPGGVGKDYTLVVRADEDAHYFLVAHEDGRITGARAAEGGSELLGERSARALLSQPMGFAAAPDAEPDVSIRMPGFALAVREGAAGEGESARVSINVGGRGVEIDAVEDGSEEAERAHVRITGVDEDAVREFIGDADGVSPEVRAQMLEALGL